MIGNFKRSGKVICKGHPKALDHDFLSFADGKIVPHVIYDIAANTGYLTIGTSHDTAKFVCDNIARVWTEHLQWQYPDADTVCLLCDGGGANSCLHHIFKQELMRLARTIGMNILVIHYPPYCSKYNPIEHRMFAPITRSWSGAPLLSVEMARQRAASTKTSYMLPSTTNPMKRRHLLKQRSNLTNRSTSYLTIACQSGTISSRRFNLKFHPNLFFYHY